MESQGPHGESEPRFGATGPLLLIATTFIWGTAFLAQKIGGNDLGPFAITCLRNILGGAFLLGLITLRKKRGNRPDYRASIKAGALCGLPLFAAMLAQQIGIQYTTPGISAFLTTNYVLFVPLIVALVTRNLPDRVTFAGALVALVGTYLICLPPGAETGIFHLGRGEAWTILCAFLFAVQILVVDRTAAKSDLLVLSAAQLWTCAALGAPFLALPSESAHLTATLSSPNLLRTVLAVLYVGVFSSGIAYTLQNCGQARTPATLASILMSLESVFGLLSGWLVLGDTISLTQGLGCTLVFLAATLTPLVRRPSNRR